MTNQKSQLNYQGRYKLFQIKKQKCILLKDEHQRILIKKAIKLKSLLIAQKTYEALAYL